MSFMTLSSKTWTQVKMIVKTWQPQVWNQVLNCDIFLQLHVPKSWQWLHYSRLGVPSLESFWGKNFNIRPLPRIMSFMTWPSKTWTQVNMIVKTWQPPQFWNLAFFLRLGNIPCLEMLHFLATPCPQVLTMIRYSRLGCPSLENKEFQHLTLAKNYVFHDLVFQDVTTSEHDCQDLAATGLKSYIFLCYNFATPCQVLTKIALFKTWLSKSWNFLLYRLSAV